MAPPQFLSRLNWRLMLIHLVACWLFIHALNTLAYLHDPELVSFFRDHPDYKEPDKFLHEFGRYGTARTDRQLRWIGYGEVAGLLAGFVLSLFIAIKNHWYWLNSLVVLFFLILLRVLKVSVWHYLKIMFLTPGSIFKELSVGYLLVNGLVMLGLGLMLFFGKKVIAFINSG
jgi:hypothetical protein